MFPDDTMMTRMMFAARKKGLMLLFFMVWIASVSGNEIPPQVFIREPPDKTAVIGGQYCKFLNEISLYFVSNLNCYTCSNILDLRNLQE